jgi:hypothetical protein
MLSTIVLILGFAPVAVNGVRHLASEEVSHLTLTMFSSVSDYQTRCNLAISWPSNGCMSINPSDHSSAR